MYTPLCNFNQVQYETLLDDGEEVTVPVCCVGHKPCKYAGQKINEGVIICEKRIFLDRGIDPDKIALIKDKEEHDEPEVRWSFKKDPSETLEDHLM